jgi:CSLREA domain-containing protein
MQRLISGVVKVSLLAAAVFVGSAIGQDAYTAVERSSDLAKERKESKSEPAGFRFNFAGIVVNSDGDETDAVPGDGVCETAVGNGICTLRAAVAEANALAGDDTITFDPSVTSISVNGQIAITSNMTIIGNGPAALTIQNTAAQGTTSRVFNITNFVVVIHGMTITGGNVTGNGGAINNTGNLTVSNCVIHDNRATAFGGGIRSTNNLTIYDTVISNNSSTASTSGGISFGGVNLTIFNSSIRNNTSSGNGGGMNISASGSATIRNSTISGNTAGAASGGLFLNRGTITNTTISGNTANGALATEGGGAVRIQAGVNTVEFISCTITDNTAPNTAAGARSGIWHETGTVTFANTIVADNVTQDIQRDGGTLVSNGFNLIGRNTSVTTEFPAGLPSGTDYVGTGAMPLDPMLGSLGANGGPTETHALLAESIAIDKGSAQGLARDQRGYIRTIDLPGTPNSPTGDGTDIGAFEFQSTPDVEGFAVAGRVSYAWGGGVAMAMVVIEDAQGNAQAAFTNSFGYFSFENVVAGKTYVARVNSKELQFAPQIVTVNAEITNLVFTAKD